MPIVHAIVIIEVGKNSVLRSVDWIEIAKKIDIGKRNLVGYVTIVGREARSVIKTGPLIVITIA